MDDFSENLEGFDDIWWNEFSEFPIFHQLENINYQDFNDLQLDIPEDIVDRRLNNDLPSTSASTSDDGPHMDPLLYEDFLKKHLDLKTYGDKLKWVDGQENLFQVKMSHMKSNSWSPDDFVVFLDWDRAKGRNLDSQSSKDLTESKGRFRSALKKIKEIQEESKMQKSDYRFYRVLNTMEGIKRKRKRARQEPAKRVKHDSLEDQAAVLDSIESAKPMEGVTTDEPSPFEYFSSQ